MSPLAPHCNSRMKNARRARSERAVCGCDAAGLPRPTSLCPGRIPHKAREERAGGLLPGWPTHRSTKQARAEKARAERPHRADCLTSQWGGGLRWETKEQRDEKEEEKKNTSCHLGRIQPTSTHQTLHTHNARARHRRGTPQTERPPAGRGKCGRPRNAACGWVKVRGQPQPGWPRSPHAADPRFPVAPATVPLANRPQTGHAAPQNKPGGAGLHGRSLWSREHRRHRWECAQTQNASARGHVWASLEQGRRGRDQGSGGEGTAEAYTYERVRAESH